MSNGVIGERPKSVHVAVLCLWVSAAIVALLSIASVLGMYGLPAGFDITVTNMITIAFLVLAATKIGARRNWARWFFTVLYVLGSGIFLVVILVAPEELAQWPPVSTLSAIVQVTLQTIALVLLFNKTSRQWFRDR